MSSTSTRVAPAVCVLGLAWSAVAQARDLPRVGHFAPHRVQSATFDNGELRERLVFEQVIRRPGSSFLAIEFGRVTLGSGSRLEILGTAATHRQVFWPDTIRTHSNYFVGDTITLRLWAGPRSTGNAVAIRAVAVSDRPGAGISSLCGSDSRTRSRTSGIARLIITDMANAIFVGTAFLYSSRNGNCFATAGHNLVDGAHRAKSITVEFNVPSSDGAGSMRPATEQFLWEGMPPATDFVTSAVEDWGVFRTLASSTTRLPAGYGKQALPMGGSPRWPHDVTVTGHGRDATPPSNNFTQQQASGAFPGLISGAPKLFKHRADTMPGNSGSPVLQFGVAVGVHVQGGCTAAAASFNRATFATVPAFVAARSRAQDQANLAVVRFAPPAQIVAGGTITLSSEIRNPGTIPTGAVESAYYLSKDKDFLTGLIRLGTFTTTGLNANQSHSHTMQAIVPASLPPGDYYVGVLADHRNGLHESFEADNFMGSFRRGYAPGIDLAVLELQLLQGDLHAGERIDFTVRHRNGGVQPSGRSVVSGIFLSADPTITADDLFLTRITVPALASLGVARTTVRGLQLPYQLGAGPWHLGAIVDLEREVLESNEANNTLADVARPGKAYAGPQRRLEYREALEWDRGLGAPKARLDYFTVKASTGGTANIEIIAPSIPRHAYLLYWTTNQTGAWDGYSDFSFAFVNSPIFASWLGVLDGRGRGTARFAVPANAVTLSASLFPVTHGLFASPSLNAIIGQGSNSISTWIQR